MERWQALNVGYENTKGEYSASRVFVQAFSHKRGPDAP
jgi:hypothetical protein